MVNPSQQRIRIAVLGAGAFGLNHLRVLSQLPEAELVAVVEPDRERREAAASQFSCAGLADVTELPPIEAAVVAAPTVVHAELGVTLLAKGIDVLVEKPIAADLSSAASLNELASRNGRILQVGHLERFNPAIAALQKLVHLPLFFEIHRLSVFSPRSLDVDVVLDLMIHDVDIVLAFTGLLPDEIRAAGISILSPKVDIANVRLAFPGGCIANLTASRVSTERVRKIRLFQPGQYISLDYHRQDLALFTVGTDAQGEREVEYSSPAITPGEPLKLELRSFLECVRTRNKPLVSGEEATRALRVALAILDKIEEHAAIAAQTIRRSAATSGALRSS